MTQKKDAQFSQDVFPQPEFSDNGKRPPRGVVQDKSGSSFARAASPQPAPPQKRARAQPSVTSFPRTHSRSSRKRKTVPLTLWVKPGVRAELERIGAVEGSSLSAIGGAF